MCAVNKFEFLSNGLVCKSLIVKTKGSKFDKLLRNDYGTLAKKN